MRSRFFGFPPIHVSSAWIVPESSPAVGSSFIAARMRCARNHAVFGVRSYFRSISRADTPFLAAHMSRIQEPGTERHLRPVEDRSDEHGELLAAVTALPYAALRAAAGAVASLGKHYFLKPANGTDRATRSLTDLGLSRQTAPIVHTVQGLIVWRVPVVSNLFAADRGHLDLPANRRLYVTVPRNASRPVPPEPWPTGLTFARTR